MIASLAYQISYRYLKPFMSYRGFKRWKSDTYTHTHTHTPIHTSGRQLKITSLDVLDYSEYSDANSSKFFFFHENIASSVRKQNYLNFQLKILQLLKNFKKPRIFKSQYIKIFEFQVFEVSFVSSILEFFNFWFKEEKIINK